MDKKLIIGLLLFAVLMLVDKIIFPGAVPGWTALLLEAVALILIVTGAVRTGKRYRERGEEDLSAAIPFDPEKQEAVIHCSICSGEKTAGFKDRETGHFVEVMLINSPEDEKKFKKIYKLEDVKTEY